MGSQNVGQKNLEPPLLFVTQETYRMTQCRATEMNMATSSQGLLQGGMTSRLESSLRALSALSISMTTITVSASVQALVLPTCSEIGDEGAQGGWVSAGGMLMVCVEHINTSTRICNFGQGQRACPGLAHLSGQT